MNKLTPKINSNKCVPDYQFGFRQKHCTIKQTHRVIRNHSQRTTASSILFKNISKAFDRVWLKGMVYNLKLNLNISKLLENYIIARKCIVYENYILSALQRVCVTGQYFSPRVEFNLFMPRGSYTHYFTYADDPAFVCTHLDPYEISRRLQKHFF